MAFDHFDLVPPGCRANGYRALNAGTSTRDLAAIDRLMGGCLASSPSCEQAYVSVSLERDVSVGN
ncbi:hypothetical protein RRF57_001887 [Xylaria bambusicola]|uniref:Uncharacterized protein n=1 Tax=Xylaria bambusicola TaxID=326684 RepID=A0AAN7UEG6_9PEZI